MRLVVSTCHELNQDNNAYTVGKVCNCYILYVNSFTNIIFMNSNEKYINVNIPLEREREREGVYDYILLIKCRCLY